MAAGSFHVLHITRRGPAQPRRPQRIYDPEPGTFAGQTPLRPAKSGAYVTSYLIPGGNGEQVHYRNGYEPCYRARRW